MPRDRYKLSIAVFIVLFREGTTFMIRRKATGWMDGMFSIAAGGLEVGETLRAAARREASEELGIRIAPPNLVHSHTLHARTATGDWVGHFFTALAWDGEPHAAEPDKHDDCGWHRLDDLPDATIPYVRHALHQIAQGNAYSEYGWPD